MFRSQLFLIAFSSLSLLACGGGSSSGSEDDTTDDSGSNTSTESSSELFSVWVVNDSGTEAAYLRDGDGNALQVNVQSVAEVSVSGVPYALVEATGIPDYQFNLSSDQYDWLTGRPKAATDFIGGAPAVSVGDTIEFGENIGYRNNNCPDNEGRGYWPPGPGCPEDKSKQGYFTSEPTSSSTECSTAAGAVGYAVNGASIYNWTDAQSYNNQGVWQTLAPLAEVYDVDLCGGHAADGDYHHHFYSSCWATVSGETETGHSPIYGYAADGYPVYGPWVDTGVLAQSCWQKRDYSAASSTGCGVDGERSCLMADQYDPAAGTVDAGYDGPTTSGSYTSLSGNNFDTSSGFFFQDYYYDSSCAESGDAYLDQYNGHTDAVRGYHYHLTIDNDGSPVFPFTVGPRYAGELPANAIANCGR